MIKKNKHWTTKLSEVLVQPKETVLTTGLKAKD